MGVSSFKSGQGISIQCELEVQQEKIEDFQCWQAILNNLKKYLDYSHLA